MWGAISRRGASDFLVFTGIMKATYYCEVILEGTLKPFLQAVYPTQHRFMQDNDPKHTSKSAQACMIKNDILWWKTPAESPNLNPIEMVWAHLKAWVQERRPSNIEELTDAVQEYRCTQLTPQLCNRCGPI